MPPFETVRKLLLDPVCPVAFDLLISWPPLANGNTPVTPVVKGSPVQLVSVPLDGVPSTGVTSVGEVAKHKAPLPVSFVTAVARLALVGVAKKVATPAAKPLTPVLIGSPVQLVNVPLDGVPNDGVTNAGEDSVGPACRTKSPVPVPVYSSAVKW